MKTLSKYIPSALIISLLAFILTTGPVLALPGVPPTVPPVSKNNTTVPTVPSVPSNGDVPTVPPVPTIPGSCSGCQPTVTSQPQNNPTSTPTAQNNGGPTSTPEPGRGGPSPSGETKDGQQEQVLGLSKTSGEITGELSLMLVGLAIAFFGFRNVLSQKILKK